MNIENKTETVFRAHVFTDGTADLLAVIRGSKMTAAYLPALEEMLPAVELGVFVKQALFAPTGLLLLLVSQEGQLYLSELDSNDEDEEEEFGEEEFGEEEFEEEFAEDMNSDDELGGLTKAEFEQALADEMNNSEGFFELIERTPRNQKVVQCVFVDDGEELICLCENGTLWRAPLWGDWTKVSDGFEAMTSLQISVAGCTVLLSSTSHMRAIGLDKRSIIDEQNELSFEASAQNGIVSSSFSCDGEEVFLCLADGEMKLWQLKDNAFKNLPPLAAGIKECAFSADRANFIALSEDELWVLRGEKWCVLKEKYFKNSGKPHMSSDAEFVFILDDLNFIRKFDLLQEESEVFRPLNMSERSVD